MGVKKCLKGVVRSFLIRRIRNEWIERIKLIKKTSNLLTNAECKEIQEYWGQLHYHVNIVSHKLLKTLSHYDKHFVPKDLYVSLIMPSLNPRMDSAVLVNKGLYDVLFKQIPQAKCYVKNIAGTFWIGMKVVSEDAAINFLKSNVGEFVIKPSCDSSGGNNVRKVNMSAVQDKTQYLKELFCEYKQDFVVQEIIRQHKDTAQFNPDSLNTIRMTTLNLNGKFTILASGLRCGQKGAVVDNLAGGGIYVPIDTVGCLYEYGFDHFGNKHAKSSYDISFRGMKIETYSRLVEFVTMHHVVFPTCHFIGWDLAINEKGEPLMVEINLNCPIIFVQQVATGPIFGDRTDEVIEYVKTHPGKLYMSF